MFYKYSGSIGSLVIPETPAPPARPPPGPPWTAQPAGANRIFIAQLLKHISPEINLNVKLSICIPGPAAFIPAPFLPPTAFPTPGAPPREFSDVYICRHRRYKRAPEGRLLKGYARRYTCLRSMRISSSNRRPPGAPLYFEARLEYRK